MGDISELRGLIFVVSFLGVLALLISWIPVEIYTAGSMRVVSTPEALFETFDIYSFAETLTIQLNETGGSDWIVDPTFYEISIDLGNHDITYYYKKANETGLASALMHRYNIYLIIPTTHRLEWFDNDGVRRDVGDNFLEVASIQNNINEDNSTSSFRASCEHLSYRTVFGFNSSLYSNFTHAWNQHGLYVLFGVNFDDVGTSFNAFELVAMLLFFQFPNTNPYVNAMMKIPVWVAVGYLAYVLVIKVIPLIAGG